MFGKWIARNASRHGIDSGSLAVLAPFRRTPLSALDEAAAASHQVAIEPGLFDESLPDDHEVFLQSGSIQIQTHSGYVLRLSADQPPARFPLPLKPVVGSLYAAEPCTLLAVPTRHVHSQASSRPMAIPRPEMTPDERDTLEALRKYFRRQRCDLPSLPDLALKIGKAIDDDLLEEIETSLLVADVGVEATREIIDDLTRRYGAEGEQTAAFRAGAARRRRR